VKVVVTSSSNIPPPVIFSLGGGMLLLLVLKEVALGGSGTGSSDNVGHVPVWGEVRSLFPCGGKRV
jgi:hypothetical protein